MNIEFFVPYIFYLILFIVSSRIIWNIFSKFIIIRYMKNFVDYVSILEYFMKKAYEIIHKDRVLVYSLDGMKLSDEEFVAISNDFINLVKKLLGPKLYAEFINLYGNEETFYFNLAEYFNTQYEDDEIRRDSLDALTNDEEQEV